MALADDIREFRKSLGLTQQEFATQLGLCISTTVRYEHGANPHPRQLEKMRLFAQKSGKAQHAARLKEHLYVALRDKAGL